jgi:DNA-binding NarL/FixJ family response regulator
MDVNLPGMTGMEATRRIGQLLPSTIVVLLSTYDRAEYGGEVDECGAAAFVGKSTFDGDAVRQAWSVGTEREANAKDSHGSGTADARPSA